MDLDHISPELQEKIKAASTPEELLSLAKQEGYELSDEDLETVVGGVNAEWACRNKSDDCLSHLF